MGLVVVTGIQGLVGSAVARAFAARGWRVRGLVRRPSPDAAYEQHVGDVTDPSTLRGLCRDADAVVHAAGLVSDWDPEELFWQINYEGTRAVLDDALREGVGRLVYISTADVFGFRRDVVIDERLPKRVPDYPYSTSKYEAEKLAFGYIERGLDVSVVYPTWIFGPGDRHIVPELAEGMRTGQLVYFSRGRTPLELTYSENLADAIHLVATSDQAVGEGYIVGDGYDYTLGDFIDQIAATAGLRPPRFSVPLRVAWMVGWGSEIVTRLRGGDRRPLLTRYAVSSAGFGMRYDISKLCALGWRPAVGVEEAIQRTLDDAPAAAPVPA